MLRNKDIPPYSNLASNHPGLATFIAGLPPIQLVSLGSGEAEFYGGSWNVARKLGMHSPLACKAHWSHGWFCGREAKERINPVAITCNDNRRVRFLVANQAQADFLKEHGFADSHAVGLPYLYAEAKPAKRMPGTLLVCPEHASNFTKHNWTRQSVAYAEAVDAIKDRFQAVVVCLSANCVESGYWFPEFEKRGIPWITGASIYDCNALIRMRYIFQSFEFVTSNTIGSHIAYAASEGSKVSVWFLQNNYTPNAYKDEPFYQRHPELCPQNEEEYLQRLQWYKKEYKFLFVNEPTDASNQSEWAKRELGIEYMRPAEELATLLGWAPEDRAYKRYLKTIPEFAQQEDKFGFLTEIQFAIEIGQLEEALKMIAEVKQRGEKLPGLDLARAKVFLRRNAVLAAYEALKEELRHFPDSIEARGLYERLMKLVPPAQHVYRPDFHKDFDEILEKVWPYTMLSPARLYNLYRLARRVCDENVPGVFVECGVAGGGSTMLLSMVLQKYGTPERKLYAFDTFEGMPTPSEKDIDAAGNKAEDSGFGSGTCAGPLEFVSGNLIGIGTNGHVELVKGLFQETLPLNKEHIGQIALLHMDGDWYESTKCILNNLYPNLSPRSFVQVDDYGAWQGCKEALHEFESSVNQKFMLHGIDGTGCWFQRPLSYELNPKIPSKYVEVFNSVDPTRFGITSQMSQNERYQLFHALAHHVPRKNGNVTFVEIGSFSGASLLLTVLTLGRLGVQQKGYSIEPHGTQEFFHVLKQVDKYVVHLKQFSSAAIEFFNSERFSGNDSPGFIFVDGDHTYEGIKQDILNYYPLLKPGGIIAFHDFLPEPNAENKEVLMFHHAGTLPGVRQACLEIMECQFAAEVLDVPLLYPDDPMQSQARFPEISGVRSTLRFYRKPIL